MIDAQISRPKADRDYESLDCQTVRRVLGEARQGVKEGLPWWHNAPFRVPIKHIALCFECGRRLVCEMPQESRK